MPAKKKKAYDAAYKMKVMEHAEKTYKQRGS